MWALVMAASAIDPAKVIFYPHEDWIETNKVASVTKGVGVEAEPSCRDDLGLTDESA